MPALQVREFPEDLYEELKKHAARSHRSIAQQTVFMVEQAISVQPLPAEQRQSSLSPYGYRFESEADRAVRLQKRKEIFERIAARAGEVPSELPSPADMVRESRDERAQELDARTELLLDKAGRA